MRRGPLAWGGDRPGFRQRPFGARDRRRAGLDRRCRVRSRWPSPGAHRGDRVGELSPVPVPHGGVLHERDVDQLTDIGRQVGRQRRGCLFDVFHGDREGAVTGERPFARKCFVANDSQGIDIARRDGILAERLLGGDVLGGTHHHPGLGHRGGVDGLGDAEVGQFHLAGRCDEDVARLDVAVHQTGGVRDLECAAGLLQHVQGVP